MPSRGQALPSRNTTSDRQAFMENMHRMEQMVQEQQISDNVEEQPGQNHGHSDEVQPISGDLISVSGEPVIDQQIMDDGTVHVQGDASRQNSGNEKRPKGNYPFVTLFVVAICLSVGAVIACLVTLHFRKRAFKQSLQVFQDPNPTQNTEAPVTDSKSTDRCTEIVIENGKDIVVDGDGIVTVTTPSS